MFKMKKLNGANMDIDLNSKDKVSWKQDTCPWSVVDKKDHKCAVKNISICDYFHGVEDPDSVLCSYPKKEGNN